MGSWSEFIWIVRVYYAGQSQIEIYLQALLQCTSHFATWRFILGNSIG